MTAAGSAKAGEGSLLNERDLSLIINTIPTTAWTTRPDGYCDFLNRRWLDYAGMTAEQAEGWGWAEAIHPDDRPRLVGHWQACLASGVPVETEGRMRRFDGSYCWFLFRANPLRDESGNIVKWYGTNIDIDDRKRGEEVLRARELSWRQIVDHIPGLVCTWDARGQVEFVNRQTLEYFGRTREELLDWALIDAIHPDDLSRVMEARKQALEAGQAYESVHRCRRADGMYRWFQVRAQPVRGAGGEVMAWYLLLTDIDDRKKAEEALQSSEHNLNEIINAIPTVVGVMRADGTPLYGNQGVTDYLGLTLEDLQKGDFRARIYHPEDLARLREPRRVAFTRPVPFENEIRVLGKDGKYRAFLFRYKPLLDEAGTIDRWFMAALDIEDRKEAEEALRRSERQFRLLVETIPALVWRSTPEGDLDYLNHKAVEYLGHTAEGLAGGRWLELVHPDHRDATLQRWLQSATTGTSYEDEYPLRRADGQHRWIQSVGEPFRDTEGRITNWYGVVFDVEDRKRAEEALALARSELAHMARVTTLSALTASISHEINQPIAAVTASASACLRWLNRDEPEVQRAREAALRIEEAGNRAAKIVAHLKSFYKKDVSPRRGMVAVNGLVDEMLVLLRSEGQRHAVVVRTELAAELPPVTGDRVQLQQVLMNLILNGMEAMSDRGGELTVSTFREPTVVRVSVGDSGGGIPAERMEAIFNPFFTTKAGGMGMGLAISRTIIESHGGQLWAAPNPERGATFHFTLPTGAGA
jgi:PAS domain S-box-containing protein